MTLLEHGSDPNAQNRRGETVLMIAVECGQSSIVEILLHHNANMNIIDSTGNTALSLTPEGSRVARILHEHSASSDKQRGKHRVAAEPRPHSNISRTPPRSIKPTISESAEERKKKLEKKKVEESMRNIRGSTSESRTKSDTEGYYLD